MSFEAAIEKLAELSGKIRVTKQDGAARLREYLPKDNVFAYVDPPYVEKGSSLYMSAFKEDDHMSAGEGPERPCRTRTGC